MSTVLLDTTVASLLHPKKKQDALRAQYEPHMQGQILALSFQTGSEVGLTIFRLRITGITASVFWLFGLFT